MRKLLLLFTFFIYSWANGQSTDATITGKIKDQKGEDLPGVTIKVKNESTGFTTATTTNLRGEYFFQQLPLGKPYTIMVSSIGFSPQTFKDYQLNQGDKLIIDVTLKEGTTDLAEIIVSANSFQNKETERAGAAIAISSNQMKTLPLENRNFTALTNLAPTQGRAGSFSGQRVSSTNFTVDGASARNNLTDGPVGRRYTITMEAIREYQITTNSYDVSQGRQGGGAINAVTKSGTNKMEGSAFVFSRNDALASKYDVRGTARKVDFYAYQYGFSLGGALKKDKLHYFMAFEREDSGEPVNIADVFDKEQEVRFGITKANLDRVVQIGVEKYGLNPDRQQYGQFLRKNVANTFFGRLDWQINPKNTLTFRNNYSDWNSPLSVNDNSNINLWETWSGFTTNENSTLVSLRSEIKSNLTNEFKVQYQHVNRKYTTSADIPSANIPRAIITVTSPFPTEANPNATQTRTVQLGGQRFTPETNIDKNLHVINTSYLKLGKLNFKFGTDNSISFLNTLLVNEMNGRFFFANLNDFADVKPSRYAREVPITGDPSVIQTVFDLSAFGQLDFKPTPNVDLMLGLRYDVTMFANQGTYNQTVDQELGALISTEKNPNDMVLTKNGKTLFVSHGNANVVSVINTETNQKIEELDCSLYPNAPIGSTPNAVALNESEDKLLIANADNNCLVVFDIEEAGKSESLGFIPTGWYPTSIKIIGQKVFVTNGKGFTSKPNPKGPNPISSRSPLFKGGNPAAVRGSEYIGGLFKGTLSIFDFPDEKALDGLTKLVYENTPYNTDKKNLSDGETGNPIPRKVGDKSPIKYVFYVIKENRTYDQVLGDMKEGNGDSKLCLFPEKITPNQHAIAKEFVLLDNFYVDAEVSADGHNWSTAAYANDYVEKTWVASYGGRGGSYDYEGQRAIAYPKDGFIWDFAHRAGISFRSYGEFVENRLKLPNLEDNYCPTFSSYNLAIKDITRVDQWKADFDSLKAINKIPQMNIIRLGNDHTAGSRLGFPTTEAMVADNDLAVGRLIEHLSNSGIWEQSAIFILEDDAQNGSDHVDAHRSTAYVAGGYVKRGYVDHTMYSTSGMLRTMELILGIPPMSQYDAAATPMWRCFDKMPNSKPFVARKNNIDLDEPNVKNTNSEKSGKIDISQPDLINDAEFSKIVWESVKGIGTPMPTPKRGAFLKIVDKD